MKKLKTKNNRIYDKINEAVRLLCDVYDILNEEEEEIITDPVEDTLLKISKFLKKYPDFTNGQIRNYIHQNLKDFNEKVTVRLGTTIFIKEKAFFQWIKGEI